VKKIKHLAPTGIRTPDGPPRSKSLYRLRYLSPNNTTTTTTTNNNNNNNNNNNSLLTG